MTVILLAWFEWGFFLPFLMDKKDFSKSSSKSKREITIIFNYHERNLQCIFSKKQNMPWIMNWYSDRRFCGFTKNSITEVFVGLKTFELWITTSLNFSTFQCKKNL